MKHLLPEPKNMIQYDSGMQNVICNMQRRSTVKLWNCEIVKSWNCGIVKLWNCGTVEHLLDSYFGHITAFRGIYIRKFFDFWV